AGFLTVRGALSQVTIQPTRKVIKLAGGPIEAPLSDAILSGNTLYLAGRIGLDPKTGKAPEKTEDEIKLLLDSEKDVLACGGMTMDDLVYVQIACTRSEEHTSELQSLAYLVCRLLLEKKKNKQTEPINDHSLPLTCRSAPGSFQTPAPRSP